MRVGATNDANGRNETCAYCNRRKNLGQFDQALTAFHQWYQDRHDERYAFPKGPTQVAARNSRVHPCARAYVTLERGTKYVRVVVEQYGQRSSVCFVRVSDGAVMKCAGWKVPFIAKGGQNDPMTIRGSIYQLAKLNRSWWA